MFARGRGGSGGNRVAIGDRTREPKDAIMLRRRFSDVRDAYAPAHAIVDTVREPLVVLDGNCAPSPPAAPSI
jgi:hypothetical protein